MLLQSTATCACTGPRLVAERVPAPRLARFPLCTALHLTALACSALHCTAIHCTAPHCAGLTKMVSRLGKEGSWRKALEIYQSLPQTGVCPDTAITNAAISACDKGALSESVLPKYYACTAVCLSSNGILQCPLALPTESKLKVSSSFAL